MTADPALSEQHIYVPYASQKCTPQTPQHTKKKKPHKPLKSLQCEDVKHVLGQNMRQNASSHKLYYYRAHATALQDIFLKTLWHITSL